MTEDDWRLNGQEHMVGLTLFRRQWRQSRPHWDHDHCEFCLAKFGAADEDKALSEGYTTDDEYRWVCNVCFSDFKDQFKWTIVEEESPPKIQD